MVRGSYLLYWSFAFHALQFPVRILQSFIFRTERNFVRRNNKCETLDIAFINEWKLQPPSVRVNNRHDNVLRPTTFVNATTERDTMLCGSYITRHAITDVIWIWWAVNGRNRPVLLLLLMMIMWCSVNIKRQSLMSLWLCPQYTSSAKWTWTSNVAYSMSDYTVSTKFHVNRNKIKTPYPRRLARSAFFSRTSFKQ